MNTKTFLLLLAGIVALGGSLGGAFVGGMALGKGQGKEVAASSQPAPSSLAQQSSDPLNSAQMGQLRERLQSGQLGSQDLEQFRQQFQGQAGQGAGTPGLMGRGGLTGAIEAIDGDTLTINTAQGPLQATIADDTTIQRYTESTLSDLLEGVQVTVVGQRAEDGTVEARSVTVIPEGEAGVFGGGVVPGKRQ